MSMFENESVWREEKSLVGWEEVQMLPDEQADLGKLQTHLKDLIAGLISSDGCSFKRMLL